MYTRRRAQIDLIILLSVTFGIAVVCHVFEVYEDISAFFISHEAYEIDELALVLVLFAIGSLVFSFRRLADVQQEIKERKRIQAELARQNETLDEIVKQRTKELTQTVSQLQQTLIDNERTREQFNKSDQRYKEMFMNMTQGVGFVDSDETVRFCNPAYAHIFEVDSAESLIGVNLSQFLTPEAFEQAKEKTVDRKAGDFSSYEIEIITAKKNKKSILVSAARKFDTDGNFEGVFGTITDLTELKRMQELAQRAERLDEAGRVAGQIAHDFNNLLSPLVAYPELIKRKLPPEHPVIPYIETIEYSARQISDINQDLLTLGRRGHFTVKALELAKVCEKLIDQFSRLHEHILFVTDFQPGVPKINGGQSQLTRTIVNLIANAADAMPAGGTITLSTQRVSVSGKHGSFGNIPDGEYVVLSISDTGTGIPPDVLPKIMDPFFSTKKANDKRGSGLGLSVVYSVIKDHKGYIDVQSEIGRGTRFDLYFPPASDTIDEAHTRTVLQGTEKILIVDDDAMQREVLTTLLRSIRYTVYSTANGEEALAFLEKNEVDLILMDTVLPGQFDGIETFKQVFRRRPDQKGILMSGTVELLSAELTQELGITKFLSKPLDLPLLSSALREVLDGRKEPAHA